LTYDTAEMTLKKGKVLKVLTSGIQEGLSKNNTVFF